MGSDRLSKAARAAGYAMATSEDLLTISARVANADRNAWRPAGPKLLSARMPHSAGAGEWRKSLFGMFGWGAPA